MTSGRLHPGRYDAGVTPRVPILIVDDSSAKRLAMKAVLQPLGYSITEADSGLAALRCVMAEDFAVILLDVRMPVMNGFETAAMIRQRWQSETTPIIYITAHGRDEIAAIDRYAEGAFDFIFAPFAPEELRAKVAVFAKLFTRAETLAARALEVQASADQLRVLTEAAPVGIFLTDAGNRYVYTNPRWSEITGILPEQAEGQAWDAFYDDGASASPLATAPGEVPDEAELSHRFQIREAGADARILQVTSKPMRSRNGEVTGWVGTLADVTSEIGSEVAMVEARDEATEASRLKSDFLANMSHEIRTPMNGVIGMTELLLETDLDPLQRDYAETVRTSGNALLTIIDDILDFSKVEAGKLSIETIGFNADSIVADVLDLLADRAQTKGLVLVADVDDSVPNGLLGDPGRVRQVLTNLVGNAIKFTQTGEIVVRVTRLDAGGGDAVVRFEVSDTGDGIAPDKLELVFQPFVQADTSTSRRYGGTGLGLAISAQLVALMGGDCGVESDLGTGSTFWFTIRAHVDVANGRGDGLLLDPDLAGTSVLIVDHNPTSRSVLYDILTDWGMTVNTAASGNTALSALSAAARRGEPFPVAIIDRLMPGMDGLELQRAIAADPSLTVRVVLMTTLALAREAGHEELGIVASLPKPIHRPALRACLRIALELPAEPRAAIDLTAGPGSPARDPHSGWLLLAEDNLINQKVAVAMLSGAGYRVDTVLDGAAAVVAAAAQPYDAILMDCQMPELNGYEATAAIRAREGSGRHTPIIAMTAGARQADRDRCLAEGMDAYVSKPVGKDALLALVAKTLSCRPVIASR